MNMNAVLLRSQRFEFVDTGDRLTPPCHATAWPKLRYCAFLFEKLDSLIPECKGQLHFATVSPSQVNDTLSGGLLPIGCSYTQTWPCRPSVVLDLPRMYCTCCTASRPASLLISSYELLRSDYQASIAIKNLGKNECQMMNNHRVVTDLHIESLNLA